VFQRGTPPDGIYVFKHALVQEAAHSSLLRNARQQLHAQIAEALESQSPDLTDTQPQLFAQHYAEAGLVEKSVVCWSRPVIAPPPARHAVQCPQWSRREP
jgi:predicted ATPase